VPVRRKRSSSKGGSRKTAKKAVRAQGTPWDEHCECTQLAEGPRIASKNFIIKVKIRLYLCKFLLRIIDIYILIKIWPKKCQHEKLTTQGLAELFINHKESASDSDYGWPGVAVCVVGVWHCGAA
jgi:hypothetical protein